MKFKKIFPRLPFTLGEYRISVSKAPGLVVMTNLDTHEQIEVDQEEFYDELNESIDSFFQKNM